MNQGELHVIAGSTDGITDTAPSPQQWASLTTLRRFALFKLTRPGHDNDNFVPAMLEFGLTN